MKKSEYTDKKILIDDYEYEELFFYANSKIENEDKDFLKASWEFYESQDNKRNNGY